MGEPLQLCMRIIEYREYARTKTAIDQATDEKSTPTGPMAELVFAVEHEMLMERNARIRARQGLDK